MEKERFAELLEKLNKNDLQAAELAELRRAIRSKEYLDLIDEVIGSTVGVDANLPDAESSDRMWRAVKAALPSYPDRGIKKKARLRNFAIAAGILVILSIGISALSYFYNSAGKAVEQSIATHPILPGKDQAELLLEDGRRVDLESLPKDTVLHMNGYAIHKNRQGEIKYALTTDTDKATPYNTLVIPRGGEYRLELADGTKIWLNAETTLRYPLSFEHSNRQMELHGEAFFDVEPLRKGSLDIPMVVTTGHQRLEVLGTSFNVNAYEDEVITTLVEGKVKLSYPTLKESYLTPMQQAKYNPIGSTLEIYEVDPMYSTAWKSGNFAFDNHTIIQVMRQLARWYDVEVAFAYDVSDIRFSGQISKFEDFNTVLSLIEVTGSVRFKIEGRRITVMK